MLRNPPIQDDEYTSATTEAQNEVQRKIREIYEEMTKAEAVMDSPLDVDSHLSYIDRSLFSPLNEYYYVLDTNHAWMIYWLVNAQAVLEVASSAELKAKVSTKIKSLILNDGKDGIASGPGGQIGHVALAYAAVLALILVGDFEVLESIKENLATWFLQLKHHDGSFATHTGGEHDARSTYCVVVVADLLGLKNEELFRNTASWLASCQTYEGGFAGIEGAEAHGGYTYCALAALHLLDGASQINVDALIRWLLYRQQHLEGGFSGRTNKLVDACYAYWVGASVVIAECIVGHELFSRAALKTYLLNCCQDLRGGLRDKPGMRSDFYHTNYALMGLSLAEHVYDPAYEPRVQVEGTNYTAPVHPLFGLPIETVETARSRFQ